MNGAPSRDPAVRQQAQQMLQDLLGGAASSREVFDAYMGRVAQRLGGPRGASNCARSPSASSPARQSARQPPGPAWQSPGPARQSAALARARALDAEPEDRPRPTPPRPVPHPRSPPRPSPRPRSSVDEDARVLEQRLRSFRLRRAQMATAQQQQQEAAEEKQEEVPLPEPPLARAARSPSPCASQWSVASSHHAEVPVAPEPRPHQRFRSVSVASSEAAETRVAPEPRPGARSGPPSGAPSREPEPDLWDEDWDEPPSGFDWTSRESVDDCRLASPAPVAGGVEVDLSNFSTF